MSKPAPSIGEETPSGPAAGKLVIRREGPVARLLIDRPAKRNALSDTLLEELGAFFDKPPEGVRCVILSGAGGNFSSGLDLAEHLHRDTESVFAHSRNWHRIMESIRYGGLPVIGVLNGAVMGGGLEMASALHVRIAEQGVKFQMPEGQRGIFVGGGASANLSRLIGVSRLTEMMLTGRIYGAEDAVAINLAHYHCAAGAGMDLAVDLAGKIASNARAVNALILSALPRIAEMGPADGLFAESLAASFSTTTADAKEGVQAFLEKRPPRFNEN